MIDRAYLDGMVAEVLEAALVKRAADEGITVDELLGRIRAVRDSEPAQS